MIVIAICLAGSVTMYAQDIITLKNGNEIKAVVKEVGTDEVKYKKFDNQNGPDYTLKKAEIFMIKYENGTKDLFNEEIATSSAIIMQQTNSYNSNLNSQQLPVLKYTFGKQISPNGSEKSRFLAGFLSFLVPGVGQFYNGDIGGGFLYMGCNIVCNSVWMSSITTDYYGDTYVDETMFTIGFIGAIAVNIASIIHASQGAKKVNIARGYRLAENTFLKVQPTVIPQNMLSSGNTYAYGMNISLNF